MDCQLYIVYVGAGVQRVLIKCMGDEANDTVTEGVPRISKHIFCVSQ